MKSVNACMMEEGCDVDGCYARHLLEVLRGFQRKGYLCDTLLSAADGQSIKVHSVVIAATCQSLAAVLSTSHQSPTQWQSSAPNQIDLSQYKSASIERLVNLLYSGQMSDTDREYKELLSLLQDLSINVQYFDKFSCANNSNKNANVTDADENIKVSLSTADSKQKLVHFQLDDDHLQCDDVAVSGVKKTDDDNTAVSSALEPLDLLVSLENCRDYSAIDGMSGKSSSKLCTARRAARVKVNVASRSEKLSSKTIEKLSEVTDALTYSYIKQESSDASNGLQCRYCKKLFVTQARLNSHRWIHFVTSDGKYACKECDLVCLTKERLRHHMYRRHRFNHAASHSGRKRDSFTFDDKNSITDCEAVSSIRAHKHLSEKSLVNEGMSYKICANVSVMSNSNVHNGQDEMFTENNNITVQNKLDVNISQVTVEDRDTASRVTIDLNESLVDMNSVNPLGANKFLCSVCGSVFMNVTSLRDHMYMHTCAMPHICETCGRQFTSRRNLCKHMSVHRAKKYTCQFCEKVFATGTERRRHMHIHTGNRPFICHICEATFTQGRILNIHVRGHSKPFQCAECGQRFSQKSSLQYHVLSHSNDRRYQCELCCKAFITSTRLKSHVLTAHTNSSEKSYHCHLCSTSFVLYRHLTQHLHSHKNLRSTND